MVSVVRSFLNFFAVIAIAVAPVLAQEGSATKSELVVEIAVRDSVMAVRDSACTVEKQSLRSELEVEKAKCENWEQSYNTLKKSNETCAKALAVAVEASQEQAEKQKAKEKAEKEKEETEIMARSASLLGSFGLGMLIMWLILD